MWLDARDSRAARVGRLAKFNLDIRLDACSNGAPDSSFDSFAADAVFYDVKVCIRGYGILLPVPAPTDVVVVYSSNSV